MKHKKNKKHTKTKGKERDFISQSSDDEEKLKSRKKRRRRYSSTDADTGSSASTASSHEKRSKMKKKCKKGTKLRKGTEDNPVESTDGCFDVPLSLMSASSSMVPMTKEEWEKKQSTAKRVFDETTGRYRLIKGDGEVIEELVSRDRHREINKQATRGDGAYFQSQLLNKGT